jgi:hypothetical protein
MKIKKIKIKQHKNKTNIIIAKMEELITCNICFEDKNTNITLEHINPTGDVSDHQMCNDCYKSMRVNCCPFCRCKIVIPELLKMSATKNLLRKNLEKTVYLKQKKK